MGDGREGRRGDMGLDRCLAILGWAEIAESLGVSRLVRKELCICHCLGLCA